MKGYKNCNDRRMNVQAIIQCLTHLLTTKNRKQKTEKEEEEEEADAIRLKIGLNFTNLHAFAE